MSRAGSYPFWGTDYRPCDGGCGSSGRSSARRVEEDCSPSDRVPVPDHERNSRQCTGEQIWLNTCTFLKCCVSAESVCMCVSGAGRGLTEGVQHEGPVLETAESEGGGTSGRFRQSSVGLLLHSAPGRVRSCEAHSRLDREEMALNVSGKTLIVCMC